MTRPVIMLQEWLDKERTIKVQFIQHELNPSNPTGLLTSQTGVNGEIHILDRIQNNPLTEKAALNGMFISISKFCFDKLKPKFRTFKSKSKDSFLIKKQYKLSKEVVNSIKEIKNEFNFPREENVIENIITGHINNINVQKKIKKLKPKEIDLAALNFTINENKQKIYDLEQENKKLEYKIQKVTHLLAKSYLNIEHLENILLEHDLDSEYPAPPEDEFEKKVFEINKSLTENL
ncbi:hypothetical protein ACG94V_17390 [Acinetobacter sp. ULE_I001]|uniref:hypothetical protein n=1 Tax=unclassified Acinetobacter TaxID=196816 RepID=UPI003AF836EC